MFFSKNLGITTKWIFPKQILAISHTPWPSLIVQLPAATNWAFLFSFQSRLTFGFILHTHFPFTSFPRAPSAGEYPSPLLMCWVVAGTRWFLSFMGHAHTHTHTHGKKSRLGCWRKACLERWRETCFSGFSGRADLLPQWGAWSGPPTGSWPPRHTHRMDTRPFTRKLTQTAWLGGVPRWFSLYRKEAFQKPAPWNASGRPERIRKTRTDVYGKFSWGVESSCTVSPSSFRNGLKHWSSKGTSLHRTLRDTQGKCARTRNMLVRKMELSSFIHFSYAFSKACALCSLIQNIPVYLVLHLWNWKGKIKMFPE